MTIPTEKAYEILNIPLGASKDAIEQSYKKLALKWHPEKYAVSKRTQEALKKFKLINLAYRKLIHNNDRNEKDITLHEMFEQYRQVFHSEAAKRNKLLIGQATSTVDGKSGVPSTINKNTLLELTANNNYANSVNNSRVPLKSTSNKNNDGETENYENRYHVLRCDDPIDQGVQAAIKLKFKTLATKANELAKQGEFSKAIEKFTEALKYDTTDHRIFSNRSYCFDKINYFQEALIDAERTIALNPDWPKGYFRKGRALFGLKMYKEAEEAYEKVLEMDNINDSELDQELFKTRAQQLQEMGFSKAQSEAVLKEQVTVQAALEAMLIYSDEDRSNESCSDMDNNELDYNENDSENGEDHLSSLLKNKLNSVKSTKQTLVKSKQGTNLGSSSPTDKGSLINNPTTTATTATASYLATLMSNPSPSVSATTPSPQNSSPNSSNVQTTATGVSNGGPAPTTSLWVGNVDPSVTESTLYQIFSTYGHVTNVRCLPDKYCAFVNFKTKDDASKALNGLQGKPMEGQRLLIKYPDNPVVTPVNNLAKNKLVFDKKSETSKKLLTPSKLPGSSSVQVEERQSGSGPVNGNECYFWRTTGCMYADKCRYEHIKKNKGIDKKPWHRS